MTVEIEMDNIPRMAGGIGVAPARFTSGRLTEPAPIWMAVLQATACQAVGNGEDHAVRWDYASGRAFYTNRSAETEEILPLGVSLRGGHTLAVTWMPGETTYTLEVYRQNSRYLA